jgi:signal transduction histidine kinase
MDYGKCDVWGVSVRALLLPPMVSSPSQPRIAALDGLGAIVACPIPPSDLRAGLAALCSATASAVGADAVALRVQAGDVVSERARWGTSDAALARADAALERAHDDPATVVAAIGDNGAIAAVLSGNQAPDDGLRLAVALAAQRAGDATALAQARGDLDRTLAGMLESDERLVGRIGLDIHDGPTQHLSVGLLEIQLLQAQLEDAVTAGMVLPEGLEAAVERIYETLGGALTDMREMIGYLRPVRFQGRKLNDILADVVASFESRSGIDVDYQASGRFVADGVSVTQRITFYRVLQEALSNAQRHGQATEIHVRLSEDETGTRLVVTDNGSGFDPTPFSQPAPGSSIARFGLLGMRDRTTMLGGRFQIDSAPDTGCTVLVYLPRWTPPDAAGAA